MLICKPRNAIYLETSDGAIPFKKWFNKLKDHVSKVKILTRIERAEAGNFGNHRNLDGELYELKEAHGAGFRIYFAISGDELIIVLLGGDKHSQKTDIVKAKKLWVDYKKFKELSK